ncbi:MAG TPA: hypothetical protein V6C81_11130 [Planktothrix sp.]|jgi:hypothetical protein
MVVELIGGPLDGTVLDAPNNAPPYVVLNAHQDGPVYKAGCCGGCASKRGSVPYFFLGYEQAIRYEYPEKSQNIEALDQEVSTLSNPE